MERLRFGSLNADSKRDSIGGLRSSHLYLRIARRWSNKWVPPHIISDNGPQFIAKDFKEVIGNGSRKEGQRGSRKQDQGVGTHPGTCR